MNNKYFKPIILIEELERIDVLLASTETDNAVKGISDLNDFAPTDSFWGNWEDNL